VTTLKPNDPFVWPDPQVFTEPSIYEHYPPFGDLVLGANLAIWTRAGAHGKRGARHR